ncbi:uncharacterized protein L969DRAFT_17370 [Mixia osmundae IAM 14324]|uniref:Uncharacterized protein n=1 Tax=Mixia osmundae (strain CBS 9802 / IAM 14324 / JCM 22182 / KY 12970) TaxID=764103 RepID=G7EA96_MIXOS|nr:uncharacterized protein L969DRAFT_17370 [Mixia osmundae IAM 14324]KEI39448.1 hypothetical protein L969DRAFT_17370 [Mixia osmundae IAM 14324]GAA99756.1 hypothetical protein E5Q_06459 [Mixia osmundae IAM 14324]
MGEADETAAAPSSNSTSPLNTPHLPAVTRVPSFITSSRAYSVIAPTINSLSASAGISRTTTPVPSDAEEDTTEAYQDAKQGSKSANALHIDRSTERVPSRQTVGTSQSSWTKSGTPGVRPAVSSPSSRVPKRTTSTRGVDEMPPPTMKSPRSGKTAGKVVPVSATRSKLSKKHLEQSIRLASEALEEDKKGGRESDYAVDCYFSGLDYYLNALPKLSASGPGEDDLTLARKTALRHKVMKLLDKVGAEDVDEDAARVYAEQQEGAASGWWGPRLRRISSTSVLNGGRARPANLQANAQTGANGSTVIRGDPALGTSTEIVTTCHCGRRVSVKLPHWMTLPDDGMPKTWQEAIIATFVAGAVFIKNSPLPYLIATFFATIIQLALYLNQRFMLQQRFVLFMSSCLEAMVQLDRDLHIHRAVGEVAHVLWEAGVKSAVAFARAEGFRPPEATQPFPSMIEGRPRSDSSSIAGTPRSGYQSPHQIAGGREDDLARAMAQRRPGALARRSGKDTKPTWNSSSADSYSRFVPGEAGGTGDRLAMPSPSLPAVPRSAGTFSSNAAVRSALGESGATSPAFQHSPLAPIGTDTPPSYFDETHEGTEDEDVSAKQASWARSAAGAALRLGRMR